MLLTVEKFRNRIGNDRDALIAELQFLTGRYGSEEAAAWEKSLLKLSEAFQAPGFKPLHLFFGSRGNLALEYQLPASSSWCDVVVLGAHENKPAAVIIELKDWLTRSDRPGRAAGLIERQGSQELHPSDQVRGYTEYCRRFHSAVAEHDASVHGCVLLTRDGWSEAYNAPPNHDLAKEYPIFAVSGDSAKEFPGYFASRLTQPHEEFARKFEQGKYRQDRGFVSQIAAQILHPKSPVFELLDAQRKAFTVCRAIVEETFLNSGNQVPPKKVVIIKGPPGSGKSVIAARLWASLVTDSRMPEGDVVFTTTSQSQNSNWAYLFDRATGLGGARGVIRRATAYTPIDTGELGRLRKKHGSGFLEDATKWRENLALLRNLGQQDRDGSCDNQNLVTIVDEAHALINPEHREGRGQFGFVTGLGPQAYHIMRSSLLTVFLLDPLQGFRQRENTTVEQIRGWAKECGADEPDEISLDGTQFRCAGSTEYVTWLESLLAGKTIQENQTLARQWRGKSKPVAPPKNIVPFSSPFASDDGIPKAAEDDAVYGEDPLPSGMDFRVFSEPESLEQQLRYRVMEGHSARLLSTFSREWKTAKANAPHQLPPEYMDFCESYRLANEDRVWSRVWNFVPRGTDYTWFVAGRPGGRIALDPLSEVGCPYVVRGFDFDYVGILWLNDLTWTGNGWHVDPNNVHETGFSSLASAARKEKNQNGAATKEMLNRIAQAYRILFTRALKGVYVWVPDQVTRDYIASSALSD